MCVGTCILLTVSIEYSYGKINKKKIGHVYNSKGILVKEFMLLNKETTLDLNNLNFGIYFIKIDNKAVKVIIK